MRKQTDDGSRCDPHHHGRWRLCLRVAAGAPRAQSRFGHGRTPARVRGEQLEGKDFSDLVKTFVGDVNELQFKSGRAIDMLVTGEAADVHQVMVAVEQAGIALDLMLELRNRIMEGYQELMRMQV